MEPVIDDFERFCQIASHHSTRDSLTPIIHITEPVQNRMSIQTDSFQHRLSDTNSFKRTSSYRESRAKTKINKNKSHLNASRLPLSTNCSPSGGLRRCSDFHYSGQVFSNSISPQQHASPSQYQTDSLNVMPKSNKPSPQTARQRPGSLREKNSKNSNNKHALSRPSAPTLHPMSYLSSTAYSSSRHSMTQVEQSTKVRLRRFERNKHGHVVNKGDRDVCQSDLLSSNSDSRSSAVSNQPTNVSQSSLTDSDVIEIPAITKRSPSFALNSSQLLQPMYCKRGSSPLTQHYSNRTLRSKSWGVICNNDLPNLRGCNVLCDNTNINNLTLSNENVFVGHDGLKNGQLINVQVLGAPRVGKTSVCMQFQTSESIDDPNDSIQDKTIYNPVWVEINNLKASLTFNECDLNLDDLDENLLSLSGEILENADAYLVIYAVDDRNSFNAAKKTIIHLINYCKSSSAIILAANKSDLVRTQVVSVEEGKTLAHIYSCAFFEISTSLNHKVDDLLVGILIAVKENYKNIQKRLSRLDKNAESERNSHSSIKQRRSIHKIKQPANNMVRFFQKIFRLQK